MSAVTEWRPPSPIDWRRLSEWLLKVGPQPLARILATVRVESPEASVEYVTLKLGEKKRLFREVTAGTWAGVTESVQWVPVIPKPRRRPAVIPVRRPPARPATNAAPPKTEQRREPSSREPFHVENGELVSVVFTRKAPDEGAPYESGGKLLLPVPQEVEASDVVRPAIMAAAANTAEVEVWEVSADGGFVFRGMRALVQAAPSPVTGRVNLVFDSSDEDRGRRQHRQTAETLLLPPGTTALALALPSLLRDLKLSEAQRKLAALPPAARVSDRAGAFKKAQDLLRVAGLDAKGWDQFAGWLAESRPKLDQDTIERILRMAINTVDVPPMGVLRLATVVLQGLPPLNADFARDFAIALLENPEPALLEWARQLLATALRSAPDDTELKLARAALAMEESEYLVACQWFEDALNDADLPVDPVRLQEYLLCADASGVAAAQDAALAVFDAALSRLLGSQEIYLCREAMGDAISLEQKRGRKEAERDRIAWLLQVLVSYDERAATTQWELRCAGAFFKVSDKLDLLSVLEDCESQDALLALRVFLENTCEEALGQKNDELKQHAVSQLRYVETLMGDDEHRDSDAFRAKIAESATVRAPGKVPKAAPLIVDPPNPIAGKIVALVGGHHRTRQRVHAELLALGASAIREVAPSSESQVDTRAVRDGVGKADIVVALTDHTGHDATGILRNLLDAGASFQLVPTCFGPSRIIADIVSALSPDRKRRAR